MSQRGFTLLELLVAMAIFALLAVAGWQVFDSVNRARDRAQGHADNLAVLQYAYLQLQQDMGQIVAYQAPPKARANNTSLSNDSVNANSAVNANNDTEVADPEPFMQLQGEQISFVRFADPDPRYQTSPSLQRVDYVFNEGRLVRRQYSQTQDSPSSVSLDSVLLNEVSVGRWQAYLPEASSEFPASSNQNNTQNNTQTNTQNSNTASNNALQNGESMEEPKVMLLPKGIAVSFTYQDIPITWQFALTPEAQVITNSTNNPANNPNSNPNNNVDPSNPNNLSNNNSAAGIQNNNSNIFEGSVNAQ